MYVFLWLVCSDRSILRHNDFHLCAFPHLASDGQGVVILIVEVQPATAVPYPGVSAGAVLHHLSGVYHPYRFRCRQ